MGLEPVIAPDEVGRENDAIAPDGEYCPTLPSPVELDGLALLVPEDTAEEAAEMVEVDEATEEMMADTEVEEDTGVGGLKDEDGAGCVVELVLGLTSV